MNDTVHDCLYSAFDKVPTDAVIEKVIEIMPSEISNIAEQWGPNDTEFRDFLYTWIMGNKDLIAQHWLI